MIATSKDNRLKFPTLIVIPSRMKLFFALCVLLGMVHAALLQKGIKKLSGKKLSLGILGYNHPFLALKKYYLAVTV